MSAYIKLSTLEYPRHIGDIELDPSGMADYAHVEWVEPPIFNTSTHRLYEKAPEQRDGRWYMVWEVTAIPDEEGAKVVRAERNRRLSETDWTQGKDIPDSISTVWATYRQALRDVPAQAGFPWDINWPQQPE